MKLYNVDVSFTVLVVAENEAKAISVAAGVAADDINSTQSNNSDLQAHEIHDPQHNAIDLEDINARPFGQHKDAFLTVEELIANKTLV